MDTVRELGLTTVVVAHRESTIRMADAVIEIVPPAPLSPTPARAANAA
jgi:excinuclease UvrABC ATPase subunit